MFDERVVFLDLETTGGSIPYDRIIEIGLVEIDRGRLVGEWSTLVNPERRVPSAIQHLTGIDDEMLAQAPSFQDVSRDLFDRLDGKVLAAHNARFDYGFLRQAFSNAGLRYAAPVLCTVKLSRRLFPGHRRHNLDALIVRHAILCLDRHRALGDARVLWELAQIWRHELGGEVIARACADLLRTPKVPAALPADLFEQLPEARGVYVLHGGDDRALYVGRSANIRARVMAHFSGERAGLVDEVKRVDWVETAGELGACVQEARLVRRLAPVYNRVPGSDRELCSWHWRPDPPDSAPRLVEARGLDAYHLHDLYGVFRTRTGAIEALRKLADAHRLCRVALGLESPGPKGACAALADGDCRGACVGAERAMQHAMRLVQALSKLRIKPWPYPGPIGVRERNGTRADLHVVDRWCYLGTVDCDADFAELARTRCGFDLSTYKMLARFLGSPPRTCDILQLPNA